MAHIVPPAPIVPGMEPRPGVVDPTARLLYAGEGLDDEMVATLRTTGPLAALERWYAAAADDDRVAEPGAMVVATVDADGHPDARTLLLKGLDARGLVFYTNLGSTKARQLAAVPFAAVVLPWHPMFRQVRARGPVEAVSREEAAAYFALRPRPSQLGAWASRQSSPIASRADLEAAVAAEEDRFAGRPDVPLPDFWGGFRVRPVDVELWAGHRDRLHDRVRFTTRDGHPARLDDASAWVVQRLQP